MVSGTIRLLLNVQLNYGQILSAASLTLYFVCGAPNLDSGNLSNKLCVFFIISLNVIVFIFGRNG